MNKRIRKGAIRRNIKESLFTFFLILLMAFWAYYFLVAPAPDDLYAPARAVTLSSREENRFPAGLFAYEAEISSDPLLTKL